MTTKLRGVNEAQCSLCSNERPVNYLFYPLHHELLFQCCHLLIQTHSRNIHCRVLHEADLRFPYSLDVDLLSKRDYLAPHLNSLSIKQFRRETQQPK